MPPVAQTEQMAQMAMRAAVQPRASIRSSRIAEVRSGLCRPRPISARLGTCPSGHHSERASWVVRAAENEQKVEEVNTGGVPPGSTGSGGGGSDGDGSGGGSGSAPAAVLLASRAADSLPAGWCDVYMQGCIAARSGCAKRPCCAAPWHCRVCGGAEQRQAACGDCAALPGP